MHLNHSKRALVLMAVMAMHSGSYALTSYSCEGLVADVSVESTTGDIFAGSIGPLRWARLCNLNNAIGNITPASCKVVYSTLLAAQMAGKRIQIGASNTPTTSCENHPEWQWMTGFYFLRNLP
jgi:hypothetical protein